MLEGINIHYWGINTKTLRVIFTQDSSVIDSPFWSHLAFYKLRIFKIYQNIMVIHCFSGLKNLQSLHDVLTMTTSKHVPTRRRSI